MGERRATYPHARLLCLLTKMSDSNYKIMVSLLGFPLVNKKKLFCHASLKSAFPCSYLNYLIIPFPTACPISTGPVHLSPSWRGGPLPRGICYLKPEQTVTMKENRMKKTRLGTVTGMLRRRRKIITRCRTDMCYTCSCTSVTRRDISSNAGLSARLSTT